jgi:N6-L-threonylcarbamoyladenine synthase
VTILGIESSCDETSAAVVRDGALLSNVISSQQVHLLYGGVVPELASRAHLQAVLPVIREALAGAGISVADLDAVAATQGPGLIGSLLVGLNAGKALALARGIPFLPVHHIEAHLFSTFSAEPHPSFPFLGLVVSGGHTLLVLVRGLDHYDVLGSTIDDAAGEAFDKVAKMLDLGFPGGPEVDRRAVRGNAAAHAFPRPLMDEPGCRFSFSGIKTSVLYRVRDMLRARGATGVAALEPGEIDDLCASFQRAVVQTLVRKTLRAATEHDVHEIALAGGVSANRELRATLRDEAARAGCTVFIPDHALSTDNAAMVAILAEMKFAAGHVPTLDAPAFARITDQGFHATPQT